mmetsp:Transcript_6683/g.9698  ORF Transcript_6683/g.9698 Transcript_6683/m.9698 type:complete len:372 (+) Transcript_6683:152-1267(+)|eukprot:CAMPEP_0172423970 /NCGR_PEP_ID=MMETSP1064-20121228/19687_1 /TAXON_ID=202472 /ORGANISM="Aulacoseira subarctica , Strain CCAP 1002/5" /LENGTH=371 /DNA_ID=CAMNT_0013165621 /DNA_START=96 /DNA_END=1211 /DNA_ORIENTATION=-
MSTFRECRVQYEESMMRRFGELHSDFSGRAITMDKFSPDISNYSPAVGQQQPRQYDSDRALRLMCQAAAQVSASSSQTPFQPMASRGASQGCVAIPPMRMGAAIGNMFHGRVQSSLASRKVGLIEPNYYAQSELIAYDAMRRRVEAEMLLHHVINGRFPKQPSMAAFQGLSLPSFSGSTRSVYPHPAASILTRQLEEGLCAVEVTDASNSSRTDDDISSNDSRSTSSEVSNIQTLPSVNAPSKTMKTCQRKSAAIKKRSKGIKGKLSPLSKPKRPLNCYNLFYLDERARNMGETVLPSSRLQEVDTINRARKHVKTESSQGFLEMSRTTAQKWKALDIETRMYYDNLAKEEEKKYRAAMRSYTEQFKIVSS